MAAQQPISEEPRPQGGVSSKEKTGIFWRRCSQTPSDHSSRCTARGILAFSRNKKMMVFFCLFLIYGLSIALAAALWEHPLLLMGCYGFLSVLILLVWHEKADVIAYTTIAVLGPLGEAVAVYYGAWAYAKSSFLVPVWLPLLWGIAGLFLRRLLWMLTEKQPVGK
jgi:hypothetical protein